MTTVNHKDIIIVVPMYNERESVASMIERLNQIGLPFLLIDNQSTDGCREIALELGSEVIQRDEFGNGYGCAILKGLKVAHERGFEYMGIIDCDITYDTLFFKDVKSHLYKYHMIMGVRNFGDISLVRRIGNMIHTFFTNILFNSKLKDANTGMRLVHVKTFHGVVDEKYMGMMPQMTAFSLRNRLKIEELEYPYGERMGDSKLNKIRDGWVILRTIYKERFRKKVYTTPPPLV